jgi:glycosyltransferase involved in cell wall biosynthesis
MLLRPLLGRAKRLIAVSEFEARIFQQRLRLPADRFVVIPNGADLPAPAACASAVPRQGRLLLSVGRLERYKGHHRVIAALPKVLEAYPDTRLRIAGSGPYQRALEQQAHALGLAHYVDIRPVPASDRQAMAALLASADLVALISEYESHGIAALEAVAARRPVLVADTTALHDLAARGFAQAVPIDCSDEELGRKIVEQLRRPSIPQQPDLPTWDRCAADILDLYRTILPAKLHTPGIDMDSSAGRAAREEQA